MFEPAGTTLRACWTTSIVPLDPHLTALGVVGASSIGMYVAGLRFHRAFVFKRGGPPPSTWMFHGTGDADLERPRRIALALLPIDVIAMLYYLGTM